MKQFAYIAVCSEGHICVHYFDNAKEAFDARKQHERDYGLFLMNTIFVRIHAK